MNNILRGEPVVAEPFVRNHKVVIDHVEKIFTSDSETSGSFCALSDVNLTIDDGEFVSLLGPSGCGKSTLLEIVAGLQTPTSGQVLVDRQKVVGPGPDRTVMFQHYALFPWRTALDNVAFPLEMSGSSTADSRAKALTYLRIVGLEAAAGRFPSQLSGGMQQRVALARALACEPKVLLMDEPFSGADAITREVLQEHLLDVQRKAAKTILFVTHSVDEAIRLSDRIVVLGIKPGRVVEEFRLGKAGLNGESFAEREERFLGLRGTLRTLLREIMAAGSSLVSGPQLQ